MSGLGALRVAHAAKHYSRFGRPVAVFEDLSLEVEAGETFVLLGPSGCGKSTLLRAVAGLEALSSGGVEVSARVGIAFQDPLLLPWLTVEENVALGLGYARNRAANTPGRVQDILQRFGLIDLLGAYPSELSGGQAQRVSLARTIVTQPSILLLDEPFAALDPRTRGDMQRWLLDVQRQLSLTIVLVTHDVDEALTLGTRVGLMSARPGRLLQVWQTAGSSGPARLAEIRAHILSRYQTDAAAAGAHPGAVGERAGRDASELDGHQFLGEPYERSTATRQDAYAAHVPEVAGAGRRG